MARSGLGHPLSSRGRVGIAVVVCMLAAASSFAACVPNDSTLCFQLGRFSGTLSARDPRTGRTGTGQAIPQNDLFGYFSIPALTSDPSNPEVFVKVLDGRPVNAKFWVFYGGLTDLEYTLTIRDTTTGGFRNYVKAGGSACGGFDTSAFLTIAPPDDDLQANGDAESPENEELVTQVGCVAGADRLCLNASRFLISLLATDPRTGRTGSGLAIPQNNLFGYFSIPALTSDPNNPEVFVKVLDGVPVNGKFWVFYGSLTDLELTITVTDTTTGAVRTYHRAAGSACGGFDTSAFDPGSTPAYSVTVTKNGSGQGTVTGPGISCGSDCSESFANGTSATLTATAAAGSTFTGWSGCDAPSGITCGLTVRSHRAVTATFDAAPTSLLTVTKSGSGFGTVNGPGITCGSDCSESYARGTSAVLTAVTSTGSTFGGWSGCDTASGPVCSVAMLTDRVVTATFNSGTTSTFTLTVARAGSGQGTVTGPGIDCGADCAESYGTGTSATLTAAAASGSTFSSWTGCDSMSGVTCNVAMNSHRTVTATFNASTLSAPVLQTPAISGASITLSWSYTWSGLASSNDGYRLEESTTSAASGFVEIAQYTTHTSPYSVTLTRNAGTYYYRVRANTSQGLTAYSTVRTATVALAGDVTVYATVDNTLMNSTTDSSRANTVFPSGDVGVGCNFSVIDGPFGRTTEFVCVEGLFRFDVQSQIAGRTIQSAVLRLWVSTLGADSGTSFRVAAVARSWNTSSVTHVNFHNGAEVYNAGQSTLPAPITRAVPMEFNVTTIVQNWANNSFANNGLLVWDNVSSLPSFSVLRAVFFESADSFSNPSKKPQLSIVFR